MSELRDVAYSHGILAQKCLRVRAVGRKDVEGLDRARVTGAVWSITTLVKIVVP